VANSGGHFRVKAVCSTATSHDRPRGREKVPGIGEEKAKAHSSRTTTSTHREDRGKVLRLLPWEEDTISNSQKKRVQTNRHGKRGARPCDRGPVNTRGPNHPAVALSTGGGLTEKVCPEHGDPRALERDLRVVKRRGGFRCGIKRGASAMAARGLCRALNGRRSGPDHVAGGSAGTSRRWLRVIHPRVQRW